MGKKRLSWIAFCTITVVAAAAVAADAAPGNTYRDRYFEQQVSNGAVNVPILAQIAYRDALTSISEGDNDLAEKQLEQALRYDPDYPDAYFTLVRLKVRRLAPDAPVYLFQAFAAVWRDFRTQKLVALGAATASILALFTLSLIVCAAFAIKYFPYVAHKIKEFLEKRLNAAAPRLTAYLILLIPLVVVPGPIAALGFVTIICWVFMHRRERLLIVALITPLVLVGIFDMPVRLAATLSNPGSLTSLVARANNAAADDHLIQAIRRTSAPGTEVEKNLALGLLQLRGRRYSEASESLFEAVSADPGRKMAYINLGNVHFLQGDYEKALQGYRKAEDIDPADPVCQFNLAQGYIKTLLMKKASTALQLAAGTGIDAEKSVYADAALASYEVLPKRFSGRELWRLALTEARSLPPQKVHEFTLPLARVPLRVGAWLLLSALAAAVVVSRFVNPAKLTYQCSNCGRLTCENCAHDERDMSLCEQCAKTIESVSSERVVEALLRQKRQTAVVRRRRSVRLVTLALPGVRDIYYERVRRGFFVGALCSLSIVFIFTKGSIARDPFALVSQPPLWKTIVPVVGIVLSYLLSAKAKSASMFRSKRHGRTRHPSAETRTEQTGAADAA